MSLNCANAHRSIREIKSKWSTETVTRRGRTQEKEASASEQRLIDVRLCSQRNCGEVEMRVNLRCPQFIQTKLESFVK